MKKVNVYLLRHGKTQGNPALNGQTNVLVDQELQQDIARRVKTYGISFSTIYSSHLSRCSDLAEYIVSNFDDSSLIINSELSEMNFGIYDGREFASLTKSEWQWLEQFWDNPAAVKLPKGEMLNHFFERCIRAWHTILAELKEDTLVIAHGGTIRMILAHVLHVDWANPSWITNLAIDNQSLSHIQVTFDGNKPHYLVKSIGVTL